MASYQKRGNSWQYNVSRVINGEQRPIRKGGFRTKQEARVAATEVEMTLDRGQIDIREPIPFKVYFSDWVDDYKSHISATTMNRYENSLKAIEEYFGDLPIQKVNKRSYQRFLNNYGLTRARETGKKLNSHIRACVQLAIEEDLIKKDFTIGAVLTGKASIRNEERHLDYEDGVRLLKELNRRLGQTDKDKTITHYLLLLALTSGMRFGELLGLTRDSFDFKNNNISINKTWNYKEGKGFQETKNENSVRTIKMNQKTMTIFSNLFEVKRDNYLRLVFFSAQSKYKTITNENTNKMLKKMLHELGLPHISIHGLRHTHASILLYQSVSIFYVSQRLGHSDIETTMKYYAHITKELRIKDENSTIKTFDDMF